MANTAIFVRSPYILSQAGVANDSIRCDLYLWNSPASIPSTPNRVVSKPIPSTIQTTVYFDISEFCRDFINPVSYTEVTAATDVPVTDYCFCTAKVYKNGALQTTYTFICFDGYGYFADGQNPTYNDILLDVDTYQIKTNANSGGLTIYNDGTVAWYVKYRALSLTGTTYSDNISGLQYVPYIRDNFKGTGGNVLEVYRDTVLQASYTFLETCEPKYTPINLDFINKYGAWQRLMLFKASYDNFDVSMTDYNMMSDTPNYNILKGRKQVFNVNGNEKIKANTGWVAESYKEVIKQMMLSEIILIDNKPVKLSSKNTELHKSINKKMINYELSFEYAYMTINNVQ
jgi:hypothetical protein